MTMATEKIYDYNGRDYRTVWTHPRAKFEDRFETGLIRALLTDKTGWFIDIGAGYGRVTPVYQRPNRKVVLVDYAMNLTELAEEKYHDDKNVHYVVANAYHLPFRDDVFSGGISIRTFHHMNLPNVFLKEASRVMKSGASFLMEYANKRNLFRVGKRGTKALEKNHEEYEPLLFGTHPAYFKQVAEEADFRVVRIYGTGFFARFITSRTKFLTSLFTATEMLFDATFGKLHFAPLHFTEIKKRGKHQSDFTKKELTDILVCPACHGSLDFRALGLVKCFDCHTEYPKVGKIYDFRFTAKK